MQTLGKDVSFVMVVDGPVSRQSQDYARDKVGSVVRHVREPVREVRIRLTRLPDPAVERPAIAQAMLDVDGRPVRAQVAAPTMREAVDRLRDRLAGRVDRSNPHWEARRGRTAAGPDAPHPWRHDSPPAHRPDYYPRPAEEREVIRHKSYALARGSVEEAIEEMESLDFDFHLFTDAETGEDCVVHRGAAGGYQLATAFGRQDHGAAPRGVAVDPRPAPRLTVAEAKQRLDAAAWPFVFFVNPVIGRGAVLYRRYDGHYGLVSAQTG